MRSQELQKKMFVLCREWETGDLNRMEFCLKHNISLARFGYWRNRYLIHQKQQQGSFVEVSPSLPKRLEIMYPNGVSLKAPATISYKELKALITLY